MNIHMEKKETDVKDVFRGQEKKRKEMSVFIQEKRGTMQMSRRFHCIAVCLCEIG